MFSCFFLPLFAYVSIVLVYYTVNPLPAPGTHALILVYHRNTLYLCPHQLHIADSCATPLCTTSLSTPGTHFHLSSRRSNCSNHDIRRTSRRDGPRIARMGCITHGSTALGLSLCHASQHHRFCSTNIRTHLRAMTTTLSQYCAGPHRSPQSSPMVHCCTPCINSF